MQIRKAVGTLVFLMAFTGGSALGQSTKPNLTPSQIEAIHSRLFLYNETPGEIPKRLAHQPTGNVKLGCVGEIIDEVHVSGLDPHANFLSNLTVATMRSSLVVVGEAGHLTPHMTADKGFLYSDYQITVKQIIKNNAKAPVKVGETITVARPGGILPIGGGGRAIVADCPNFRLWGTGKQYLMYLGYVPATGAYAASNGQGSFVLNADNTEHGLDEINKGPDMPADMLMDYARRAANEAGGLRSKEGAGKSTNELH
jgi:hypothetical protein